MPANAVANSGHLDTQRKNNRRVGIILALFASTVFLTVIIRQWVSGDA